MAGNNEIEFRVRVTDEGLAPLAGALGKVDAQMDKLGKSAGDADKKIDQMGNADGLAPLAGALDKAGDKMGGLGQNAGTALDKVTGKTAEAATGMDGMAQQLQKVQSGLLALGLGASFVSLIQGAAATADEYNNLSARIKLATGAGEGFDAAMQAVQDIALRTNSTLVGTGDLFARLADAGTSAGLSSQQAAAQALGLTESINQAVQLSGASAQASDAALQQLIQGLNGGALRGEEFNSVMEQSPRLAKALADGLGVTTGALRTMANEGRLTTDVVIGALQSQADTLKSEFETLPATVGRAIQNLSTSWTVYVGEADKATGASTLAATAIDALAQNLSTITGYLLDAGQAAAAFAALRLAQTFLGIGAAATASATAVAANTTAMAAAGAAGATAAVGVGRFAAVLSTLKTFSLLGIVTNFQDIGTWIGEGIAKLQGYKDTTDELAAADKARAQVAAENLRIANDQIAANKAATDAQFGLGAAAKDTVAEFTKLVKEGKSADEAIKEIGKDFDLTSSPGIRNAVTVLDKLVTDGKLSAGQFRQAWADALKDQDLAVFEVRFKTAMLQMQVDADRAAKAVQDAIARGVSGKELEDLQAKAATAFSGLQREAERSGQVMKATLGAAVSRTGLDMKLLSDGMGEAAASALNDTDRIIAGLDDLRSEGIDVGTVLEASLTKALNTADGQKAIDEVRSRVEQLRTELGNTVADGLLDQARIKAEALKKSFDDLKPGINSAAEAMRLLGITSDASLKNTAATAKTAYDQLVSSGTASARELTLAFQKMAEAAIAANGGVATESLKAEAAMRGLEIVTDSTGKAIVRAMGSGETATSSFTNGIKNAATEVQGLMGWLDRLEKRNAEVKSTLITDSEGFAADAKGNRITAGGDLTTLTGISKFLEGAGLSTEQARKLATEFSDGKGNIPYFSNPGQMKYGGRDSTMSEALLRAAERTTFGTGTQGAQPLGSPSTNHTVNISIGGGRTTTINTASAQDSDALTDVLRQLQAAASRAG